MTVPAWRRCRRSWTAAAGEVVEAALAGAGAAALEAAGRVKVLAAVRRGRSGSTSGPGGSPGRCTVSCPRPWPEGGPASVHRSS